MRFSASAGSKSDDTAAVWAKKASSACQSMRPRFVELAQQMTSLNEQMSDPATDAQVQQVAEMFDRESGLIADLSSSISRISVPSAILERVKSIISQMDDAISKYHDAAETLRNGGNRTVIQSAVGNAPDELISSLRTMGLLGASGCADLV
jgi:hypothetical protein